MSTVNPTGNGFQVVGVPTNIDFLRNLAGHEAFVNFDEVDTGFIEKHYDSLVPAAGNAALVPLVCCVVAASNCCMGAAGVLVQGNRVPYLSYIAAPVVSAPYHYSVGSVTQQPAQYH